MGYTKAWLQYFPQNDPKQVAYFQSYVWGVPREAEDAVTASAKTEFLRGVKDMLGVEPMLVWDDVQAEENEAGMVITWTPGTLPKESYHLFCTGKQLHLEAGDPAGLLYGVFALLRRVALQEDLATLDEQVTPAFPMRMINHWDNLDGSIERGYAGRSFLYEQDEILVYGEHETRLRAYARMLASVGINAVVINNVNVKQAATHLIAPRYAKELKKLAEIFADYAVEMYMSLNFAAPLELGDLDSADPLAPEVISWWQERMTQVYADIPNLGGFLVKADSEGRPGPFTYGRNHADGANMLAHAVAPFGGKIIWRCFVYNCQQDWRDYKTDRARSGYDNFAPLDGLFLDNVILQIKNGPMDFQVREPVHPLFGGMKQTNQMLEVQIAQEYTGQQRHVCYLIPQWKEVLSFVTYQNGGVADTVADIVSGKTQKLLAQQEVLERFPGIAPGNCGIAGVGNLGRDENWTGHDLAAANLYGFGRLCVVPELSAEEIAREWSILTFGASPRVTETVVDILMRSWPAYEQYTSPLGIGWMVNPSHHYGPNVEGYEWDRWGTYHRADWRGVGVDRSSAGTGYATLYREPWASLYETVETCPEELLLFFHYVPYTYQLKSGKTLLQHIYDTHFEGAETAAAFVEAWQSLEAEIEPQAYGRTLARLREAAEHSLEWRDRVNTYFYRRCGIADEKGRKIYP